MRTKNVLIIIFSLLFFGAFIFVLTWGIINFNKVKDGMSGTGVYTKEDIDNSYQDGYSTALKNKDEYDNLISSYRDNITNLTDSISQLNSQINVLNKTNQDYKNELNNLNEIKIQNEETINSLSFQVDENNNIINNLNNEINNCYNQINSLNLSVQNKDEEISILYNQINSLQNLINQLQYTNELNLQTITNLNNQISTLNTQITDMTLKLQNNSTDVIALNNKIAELEKSIAYYESFISNLENGEQVVATFEFNGSVYNIQILNKNGTVSVVNPTSTDYVIFNYWTVDGVQVDLSTYQVQTNTRFVANLTYKYDVKFMVDENEYSSEIVLKDNYINVPDNPVKDGYEFDGWTTNGVDIVDVEAVQVTSNLIYTAKFTKLHTVTFMYEDEITETQTIRNGNFADNVIVDSSEYKVFNGWKLNDVIVDLSNIKIVADTTFIADISYYYDVTFSIDNEVVSTQKILQNNLADTIDIVTKKNGYVFKGWSLNGIDIIDINIYPITYNANFIAIYDYTTFSNDDLDVNKSFSSIVYSNELMNSVLLNETDKYTIRTNFSFYLSYDGEKFEKETSILLNVSNGVIKPTSTTVAVEVPVLTSSQSILVVFRFEITEDGSLKLNFDNSYKITILGVPRTYSLSATFITMNSILITK